MSSRHGHEDGVMVTFGWKDNRNHPDLETDEQIIAYVQEHDSDVVPEVEYDHVEEPRGGHVYENHKHEPAPDPEPVTELHIYRDTAPSWLEMVKRAADGAVDPPMPQPEDHEHSWKEMMTGAFRNEYVTYCEGCMKVKERVIHN